MTSDTLVSTLLVPFIVAFAGLFATWLASRATKKSSSVEGQKIDEIASAASVQVESSRARAMELLAEKLPQTDSGPELIRELETLAARLTPTLEVDPVQPLVRDLVNDYQRQALGQSRAQFWFSVAAAVGGFVLISYMVVTAARSNANELELAISTVPGVLVEAVAALFFTQAREVRQRATELYDRLRSDSQQSRAIELANSIEAESLRSELKAQLALHFAGIDVSRSPWNTTEQ